MNQRLIKIVLASLFILLTIPLTPHTSLAEEAAQVISVNGTCEIMKQGESKFAPLTQAANILVGDSIKTGSTGRVALKLIGGGIIRLNPNSNFVLSKTGEENSATLSAGKAFFFSRESQRFPTIQTPAVTAAVRGTEFAVEITGEQTRVAVIDGQVYAANKVGAVTLGANEVAAASKGKAPQKYLLVNPLDAVQWAIYVPDLSELDGATANKNEANTINGLNQLIKAGRLDEAQQRASSLIKNSSSKNVKAWAHASKAVISLAVNKKDKAKADAIAALDIAPESQAALYALSLVEQSFFNLDGARENIEKILALNQNSSAAKIRLAELQLSSGDTVTAERTLEALPSSPRRDAILGFAKLIRYKSAEAQDLFRSSVALNSSYALARLGLGLTQINSGDLAEGRGELEIAAALEPNVAIYRSYLGKAYFEENRSNMARHEYNRAIELDPNDPTPYLYRAFERLSKNNPVGALEDIEDSITRNNNRAVYRSSLLLDRDSGVRSASLAEVFTSLGFNRAAQIEAIKSINKNYGNFSAHKLLSESYNTINTVDALVSEQIIARAYAPLTLNLLGGPQSSASVNDYNAFFDRSEMRQRVGFIGKSAEDIMAPYAALAGRSDKSAYRVIAESAFGNGSKEDDYLRDYRFTGTLQHQLTPDLRVFTEAKYQARHVEDKYAILDDVQLETQNYTLGFNQDLSVQTKLVGQVTYRDSRQRQYSTQERPAYLDIILDGETYSFEDNLLLREFAKADFRDTRISAQLLHETDKISIIAGAEQYFGNPNRLESSIILADDFAIFDGLERELVSEGDTSLHSSDFYLYPTIHATDYLDINTGVTYTDLELEASDTAPFANETESRSKWSPKLGATLYASSDLTLRAAYFEGLRKSALEDSGTLEPTLVGGFNQIYTDFTGADAKSYGLGADYKASKSTYLGLETTIRDVNIDFDTVDSFLVVDFDNGRIDSLSAVTGVGALDYDQQYVSAYVYQILSPNWVTTLDYNFFRSEIKDPAIDQDISLHKAKGSLRYFDPSGWFAFSDLTYRDQNRINSFFEEAGSSQFWLVDLGVGYRFSNRQGSITLKGNNIFDRDFTYDQSLGFEEFLIDSMYGEIAVNFNF
jgi:ferric-dicitrate binding protein FerR (iron transport regulator)